MNARLIENDPNGPARDYPLKGEEFLIGRGDDCDLRLAVSAISRHHCMIRLRGAEATLVDLGSSNGTFLNGVRVRSQATLKSGDEIKVADFLFRLDLGDLPRAGDPAASTVNMKQLRKSLQAEQE